MTVEGFHGLGTGSFQNGSRWGAQRPRARGAGERPARAVRRHWWLGVAAFVGVAFCLGGGSPATADTLTIYGGQHQQTVAALVKGFEKVTGITVSVRHDGEAVLANQIVEEGAKSPADVFLTENSPALEFLSERNLLAPVDPATLAVVPSKYSSPQGDWVGVSARVSVLVYNTDKIHPGKLPSSILDLARPEWKGKIGFAPSETDFQPLVTAIVKLYGKAKALQWLKGLKTNGEIFPDNEAVVAAVNRGESTVGIINHYYWYRLRDELGAGRMHSALHYYASGDVGNLIDVAGAGILKSSSHRADAQKFLSYVVSKAGESIIVRSESYEYPLGSGVRSPVLPSFDRLQPPKVTVEDLGDGRSALDLVREVGLL